jgi:amino acid adenylation domain-containing protein
MDSIQRPSPQQGEQPLLLTPDLADLLRREVARAAGVPAGAIARDKPLLSLGLDSLAVIELQYGLEKALGISIPLEEMLDGIDLAGLEGLVMAALEEETADGGPIHVATDSGRELPLSPGQHALWLLQQVAAQSGPLHIAAAARALPVGGRRLDTALLGHSLAALAERHPILLSTFEESAGGPVQRLGSGQLPELVEVDATEWTEEELTDWREREAYRPFDLATGPLLRIAVARRPEGEDALVLSIHHIVADFWSVAVLVRDLSALYLREPLTRLPLAYGDYLRWQAERLHGPEGEGLWDYWLGQLSPPPASLALPSDRPRPAVTSYRGGAVALPLGPELSADLASLARRGGTTLFTAVLAGFQAFLGRWCGQRDLLVGAPAAGRGRPELAGLAGYFVNMTALRADLAGDPAFTSLLEQARGRVLGALEHQELPLPWLAERLLSQREPSDAPFLQACFVLQKAQANVDAGLAGFAVGARGARLGFGDLTLESEELAERWSQFDLVLRMGEVNGSLISSIQFSTDLFDPTTADRMLGHLRELLTAAVADPGQPFSALPLLTAAERSQLAEWNDTGRGPSAGPWIYELVMEQARRMPEAAAIVDGERRTTYGELVSRVQQLTHTLRRLGVQPEVRVGVCLERSPELVISCLAVLQAGGAYVALDPSHPEDRLSFQLADSEVPVLLTRRGPLADLAASRGIHCLFPGEMEASGSGRPEMPAPALQAGNLAYVIYTSGSTGRPKGADLSHGSLRNLVDWHIRRLGLSAADRTTMLAGVGYDATILEIWPFLTVGASLYIPPDELRTSPEELLGWMAKHGITASFLPTALAEGILDLSWGRDGAPQTALRWVLTGGDRLHRFVPEALPFQLLNAYGPTETTAVATAGEVPAGHLQARQGQVPTIGRPIAGLRVQVVRTAGGELQQVPVGVPGELLVGGAGLGRGYLRRPDLTAERFVPDPFTEDRGERLYRTGDLVRWSPEGEIEFLGRIDHQVKVRGQRIELGEIEAVLAQRSGVREATVLALDGNLVAFIAPGSAAMPAELREHARRQLPDHMVPVIFVPLSALPVNTSGKVDRHALAALGREAMLAMAGAEPGAFQSPIEELIAGIWEEVLGRSPVQRDDNFFHLGGHSLLATRVLSRVGAAFGAQIPATALFEQPTVSGLASAVAAIRRQGADTTLPPLVPMPRPERLPLSFTQRGLWFIDRLAPGSPVYNVPSAFLLSGHLEAAALASALTEVVSRHEALRTRFIERDGEPWQEILPPQPVPVPLFDLSGSEDRAADLERLRLEEACLPFDLSRGPLLRARLLRLGEAEHVLLLTLHHIVSDGWSGGVLLTELAALYAAAAESRPSPLADLPVQYADFTLWQHAWPAEVLAGQLDYWRMQLAGAPTALELPTDRPRPPAQSFRGSTRELRLPADVTAQLRQTARREGATLYMVLLAGFGTLLSRYTGQKDLLIGAPMANRTRPEVEGLIGLFVNVLALRVQATDNPDLCRLLSQVRETVLGAFTHSDLSLEALVEELKPERDLSRNPVVQALLALQGTDRVVPTKTALQLTPLRSSEGRAAKLDLALNVEELEDQGEGAALELVLEYAADLFTAATAARLLEHYATLLSAAAAAPDVPLSHLSLLAEAERHQLVAEWNDTRAPFPASTLLHQFFEATVDREPGAVAAVCAGSELTYAELEARSNRLAQLLCEVGVKRGVPVGVWVERSLDMLTAVLGVLKAGGHYVALDETWPADRVEAILAATGAPAVLAGGRLLGAVEEMQWRLPALSDVFCLGLSDPAPPAEAVDPESVRELWDFVAERAVDRVTAGGFVSAFTDEPMSGAEVDEYRDRVLSLAGPWLRPDARVLEIGNGSGLLLWEMASRVAHVSGIDPSPLTQERNREQAAQQNITNVELLTGFAHELDDLLPEDARFDLVLMASTVQFFPGPRYLEQMMRRALRRLSPGGALLIADVLDARRRGELRRAIDEERRRRGLEVASGTVQRDELYLDEGFFADLGAAVHHRTAGFPNELRFRYDVLLAGGEGDLPPVEARSKRLWTGFHVDRRESSRLAAVNAPDDIAYVIHTSGSTGEPKGIAVQHRPAANLVDWINRTFEVGPEDRGLFITSLCFDLSVYDIFGLLAVGGTVHVATREELGDPDHLVDVLRTGGITLWDSAPAALVQLAPLFPAVPDLSSRLRRVLLSGDWIPVTLPDRVRHAFPGARVMALGGATEATVWSNWFPVKEVDPSWASIPYGRPIANARYHVLDAGFTPCPIGIAGDLYIGGDCLCLGYARQPDLTAQAFLPDPFGETPGARLYYTGDRARYGADGNLEFLGRLDQQVKVRGYRIELGEIEVVLARQPGVREAVVLVREDTPGDRHLVAYVVAAASAALSAAELREALRRLLPDYMIPAAFVFLPELPVTANGKLDRKALPAPEWTSTGELVPPRTPTESALAAIWAEVLGISLVGRESKFFELGGHSLKVTQLRSRVREAFGIELPLRAFFEEQTLATQAEKIDATLRQSVEAAASPILPVERKGDLQLSFAQQRLWFLDQLEPGTQLYNIPLVGELHGDLDVAALELAFCEIVRRHESLRTVFPETANGAVQRIAPADEARMPLPVVDVSALPAAVRAGELDRLTLAAARRPFDLARGPLMRTTLLRGGDKEHVLLICCHHIVSDGWSTGVIVRELSTLYRDFVMGRPASLPALPIQYADFAAWQREWLTGEVFERQMGYWRRQLGGLEVTELPTDRPRPPMETFRGTLQPAGFSLATTDAMRELARSSGATLYMVLLAAFDVLIASYTGRTDIAVGGAVANRNRRETEDVVGFFVNTLVMRTSLAGDPSMRDLLGRVRETALAAYVHEDMPFERVVEDLQPQRDLSRNPLFQVMLVLQNIPMPPLDLPGLTVTPRYLDLGTVKFDMALVWWEDEGRVVGQLEHSTVLFDGTTMKRLLGHYEAVLARALANPDLPLSALAGPTEAERHQIVEEWNDSQSSFGPSRCIHQWMEEQAAATPDDLALVAGETQLSYRELNGMANRLAHHLRRLGIGPDVLVGICVDRTWAMVVGLLGVLKAGGAALALDQTYPEERLRYMIHDAGLALLLVEEKLMPLLPDTGIPRLRIDTDWTLIASESDANPPCDAAPDSTMYAIYTSGSTGQPKGVLFTHRAFVNLLEWQFAQSQLAHQARTVQFATFGFCVSFLEIFSVLCSGGTLVMVKEEYRRDMEALWKHLDENEIERLHLPFAALKQLADVCGEEDKVPRRLREVVTSGEQLQVGRSIRSLFSNLGCTLHNQYGTSEIHVVSSFRLPGAPASWPDISPVGRPVANTQIYLLDAQMRPLPIGVLGEIYAGGVCLARGYLGVPAQTAAKFVPDPFAARRGEAGARLYRTGDLARQLPDGRIEWFGRIDNQVRIRGFRVELGEVETAVKQHLAVRNAAVLCRPGPGGNPRLIAYIVPHEGDAVPEDLRAFLKAKLPDQMVPTVFVAMRNLPLNANGKLDLESFPNPEAGGDEASFVAPSGPIEEMVAHIWSKILDVTRVGANDNFFELGGHSLLATQVANRIRRNFNVDLPLRTLFEGPTVAELARAVVALESSPGRSEKIARAFLTVLKMSGAELEKQLQESRSAS